MPTPTEVLAAGGLSNAAVIVQAAGMIGLELASAAALAQKESGGKMIWGHDPVETGGTYTKGGPVTLENYRAYRAHPTAGWQGVGICQLTYKGYIYQAEKMHPNGAADPLTNCRVGFQALKDLQRQYGEQDGARVYNGGTSGSSASVAYGKDFIAQRQAWRQRLSGVSAPAPSSPAPGGGWDPASMPFLKEGDASALVWRLQRWLNANFAAYSRIDAGNGPTSRLGPQSVGAMTEFQRRSGIPTAPPFGWGRSSWTAAKELGFPG